MGAEVRFRSAPVPVDHGTWREAKAGPLCLDDLVS